MTKHNEIDLTPFNHPAQAPFNYNEHTIATDSFMMVIVPQQVRFMGNKPSQNLMNICDKVQDADMTDAAAIPREFSDGLIDTEECDWCDDGLGCDCPNCDCKCDRCDGTQIIDPNPKRIIVMNDFSISRCTTFKLLRLPDVRICQERLGNFAIFTFSGGRGACTTERFREPVNWIDIDLRTEVPA